jgi:hypothetical protein
MLLNSFLFINPLPAVGEGKGEGYLLKFFLSSLLSPCNSPLHSAGKGQGEGALFKSFHLPSLFSTPLERARVRGILFSPLAGENKSEGCS